MDSLLGEVTNLHDRIGSYLSDRLVPLSEEDYQSCEDGCDLSDKNIFEASPSFLKWLGCTNYFGLFISLHFSWLFLFFFHIGFDKWL